MGNVITGTDLAIDVGKNYKGKLNIHGKTEQKTRSGKNLLKDNFAMTGEGTTSPTVTTLTGQSTPKGLGIVRKITIPANNDNTFYSGCRAVTPSVVISSINNTNTISARIWIKTSMIFNTDYKIFCTGGFGTQLFVANISLDVGDWKCFELDSYTYESSGSKNEFICVHMASTSESEREILVAEAQINDGALQGWEQYGASPSPDYPSEIENVEGKNKFNVNGNLEQITGVHTTVSNNQIHIPNSEGNSHSALFDYIEVEPNKDINISFDLVQGTARVGLRLYDKDKNIINSSSVSLPNFTYNTSYQGYWYTGNNISTTIPDNVKYIRYLTIGVKGTEENIYENLQIEKGNKRTPYVPYNSLAVKVTGKNIFDCANSRIIYNNGNTSYERLDNGLKLISNGRQYNIIYFLVDTVKNLKDKTLTLSSNISFSKDNQLTALGLFYTDINGGNRKTIVDNNNITSEGKYQVTGQVEEGENRDYVCIGLRPNTASNFASGDYTIYDNLQVEIGETATPYKPYQEQKLTFPLSEGQKLYEGSYLADDGIHHKRKQIVLKGTESGYDVYGANSGLKLSNSTLIKGKTYNGDVVPEVLCNYLIKQKRTFIFTGAVDNSISINNNEIFFRLTNIATTVAELKTYLAEQYANGTPLIIEYELSEEEIVPYTTAQQEACNEMQDIYLYEGKNYINFIGTLKPELELEYLKIVDDYDFYISENGHLVIPEHSIDYLIDLNASNIPSMPEAVEASVRIVGKDGDVTLNTTYEPMNFSIVCYTDDNLTPQEKVTEEQKINRFIDSMKNETKVFAIEKDEKFYEVKYNGVLTTVRFPAHIQFTIPIKSSESYAMDLIKKRIKGNNSEHSNTIKDVGAIFTILGPAQTPKISFNNYEMFYDNVLLENTKLVIDSNKSTVTHVNGVTGKKTNAMRYYNHQFPKVKYGENVLVVNSGIDNSSQVKVEWNDLKL